MERRKNVFRGEELRRGSRKQNPALLLPLSVSVSLDMDLDLWTPELGVVMHTSCLSFLGGRGMRMVWA